MNYAWSRMVAFTMILFIVLGYAGANAAIHVFTSDSLPKTLGSSYQNDTIRFAGTSVRTPGAGLKVSAPGIFIDGRGDTLFYNSSGSDLAFGIHVTAYGDNVTIADLTVYHDEDTLSSTRESTCLWLESPNGVTLKRSTFVCYGFEVRCVDSYGGGAGTKNVVIDSCHFYNYSDSYASRYSYGGAAVRLEMRGSFTGSDFGAHISNSVIHISPHAGIVLLGKVSTVMTPGNEVSYCTTYVDHRNVGGSSANPYGIIVKDCRTPLSIHHNAILSGTKYGGSRGLILENVQGTSSDWAQIYANHIETTCGPDAENPTGINRVLRIRGIDAGGYWDYLHVYDNTFIGITDDDPATTHIGKDAAVFQFGADEGDIGHARGLFERNRVIYRALTPGTDGTAAEFSVASGFPGVPPITIRHNTYLSSQRVVWTADESNAVSAHDLMFLEDTLGYLPPGDSGIRVNPVTWTIGYYRENDRGGSAVNCAYKYGADDKDIRLYPNGSSHDFTLVQRKPVAARGYNDSLVASFDLRITDGRGRQVLNTSVLGGSVLPALTYWYESTEISGPIDYNPFTFVVKAGTDSTVSQLTIDDQTTAIVLSLPRTRGTLPLDFAYSPLGNVSDFRAKLVGTDRSGEDDVFEVSYVVPDTSSADSVVVCFSGSTYPDSLAPWRVSRAVRSGESVTDTVMFPVVEPAALFVSHWAMRSDGLWSTRGEGTIYVADTIAPVLDSLYAEPIIEVGAAPVQYR